MELTEMVKNYLIDTSFFVSVFLSEDRQHKKALEKLKEFGEIEDRKRRLLVHELVAVETLSVLKYKTGRKALEKARWMLLESGQFELLTHEGKIIDDTDWKVFFKYPRIGAIDAILVNESVRNNQELVTFDKAMEVAYFKLKRGVND